MLSESDRSLIRHCRLFDGIGMDSIEGIIDYCPIMELHTDEILLAPHQENDCVYLVLEGLLSVHLADIDAPGHIDLGPGECIGELSLVANRRPSAYVIAATDSRVLVVPPHALWSLIDHSHGVARNLLHVLAGRMLHGDRGIIASIAEHPHFEHATSVDGLTGLHNRRWLDDAFARSVRRCARSGEPLSLLIADIDRFRHYNECHGQQAGDQALRTIARTLEEKLRPTDLLARHGGEEFAILLPATSLANALLVAERLRAAVAKTGNNAMNGAALPPLTVSIGAAEMQLGDSLGSLIAQADAALYRAKLNGRNRVEIASGRAARLTA